MALRKRNILVLLMAVMAVMLLVGGIFPALRAAGGSASDSVVIRLPEDIDATIGRVDYEEGAEGFVADSLNVIIDETGSLAPFMEKLIALRTGEYTGAVNILHIGDSHVQAGFWDTRVREHFSRDFGNGGRGVILPHRLTGTNEPRDYYIRTANGTTGFRTTSNPTKEKLSFTGTAVFFDYDYPGVEIWHKGGFDAITVISHPYAPPLVPPDSLLLDTQCVAGDTEECTTYYLNRSVDTLALNAVAMQALSDVAPRPLYYGFVLHSGGGVVYHSIGSNGAAFEHIERYTTIPEGGAEQLFPDLIIVSLGTNNCYGRNYRSDNLRRVVERFMESLAVSYPGVPVLVTTPRESGQRSGRNYAPNPNIADAARVIRETASRYSFAYWDLYEAAGGKGIAEKWFENKLSGRDRIHLTEAGYNLLGDMMYDAISKYYNEYLESRDGFPAGLWVHNNKRNFFTNPDGVPNFIAFEAQQIMAAPARL